MGFAIRPYLETDRPTVIEALTALQEHERAIHDTRLPGAACSAAYLDHLMQRLAAQSGAMVIAEADGRFVPMAGS